MSSLITPIYRQLELFHPWARFWWTWAGTNMLILSYKFDWFFDEEGHLRSDGMIPWWLPSILAGAWAYQLDLSL